MPSQDTTATQELTDLIKKQIAIFGLNITLDQIKNIKGLEVDREGTVINMTEDTEFVKKQLVAAWESLSPFLSQKIAEPLIKSPQTVQQ